MNHPQPSANKVKKTDLSALQQALIDEPDRTELLNAYYQMAVTVGKVRQAQKFLERLQQSHPWNHSIRRILIAICLQQKEYQAAMDAVETLVAFSTLDDSLIDSAIAVREHLGPRTINLHSANTASISLCMIVKDEQATLGPCLNSVKNLTDELIVVDTGSKDRSADIARIYGARVFHAKWQDDFSQARNMSLEKACGDWILILDADEVIAQRDFKHLRQIVQSESNKVNAYSLQTRNYLNLANAMDWHPNDQSYPQQEAGIGWFPTDKVRLFFNNDAIRFEYPVHETVDGKLKAAGVTIRSCPVPIHHYGRLNETKNRCKADTYYKLGYSKLDQLGNDCTALRELAVQAGELGRWLEALDLWQRHLSLCPDYPEAYANMAGAHWQLGEYDRGIHYSKKAIQANPNLKEGYYNLSVNLLMNGRTEEAVEVLEGLLQQNDRYLPAKFMIAAARSILKQTEKALEVISELEKEITPQMLAFAIEDLVQKFKNSGRPDDANAIRRSMHLA